MNIRLVILFFLLLSASACSMFIPTSTKEAMARSEKEVERLKKELKALEATVQKWKLKKESS
jgi:cytochrome c biogenesis protein ResB